MTKYYLVPEHELVELIKSQMRDEMCCRDGVDSWEWYGESHDEVAEDFSPPDYDGALEFDDVASALVKHRYHEMPVVLFPPEKEFKND